MTILPCIRLCFLLLLVCFYSKAEDIDTGNILTPADDWTLYDEASTTNCSYSSPLQDGEVCTGNSSIRGGYNETDGGGIISQEYSLIEQGLSVAEIQQGFDFQYGASIESHRSNLTVPSCSNTNGDCKDYFSIKLFLNDDEGTLINKYEHLVEMNYVGVQDYTYSQSLVENNYNDVVFKMDIWSVDAGYTTGMFGGIISDPFLNIQYQTVDIITDIILDVVDDILSEDIQIEQVSFDIVVEDFYAEDLSFEIELEPIEEIEVMEVETVEAEIEMEIEAEIMEEMAEEIDEPVEETTDEPEEQEAPKAKEVKQKVANKLMASQKDKMSNEAQTTGIALMVILADNDFSSYTTRQLADTQVYQEVDLYVNQTIEDVNQGMLYMDYLSMNELLDLQWK